MIKRKIFIAGGCSFFASNLIRHAIHTQNKDFEFVSIDWAKEKSRLRNLYINKGHQFYLGDIKDFHLIDVIFQLEQPDIVLHAAESQGDDCLENNIVGTKVLLETSLKYKVKKFIYISNDQVYGKLGVDELPFDEDSVTTPNSLYSISKSTSEMVVERFGIDTGLEFQILRLCDSFGPRQSISQLVPYIISELLHTRPVELSNRGSNSRDLLHIEDVCAAVLSILKTGDANSIYNVTAGFEFTDLEVFFEIAKALKIETLTDTSPSISKKFDRVVMSGDKIKNLGWKPNFKIKKGLEATAIWYKNNQWFLKDSK